MSIITPFDFVGENMIAQKEAVPGVQQSVQIFIDKYEPKFLKVLWGKTLYEEFVVGITPVPVDPPTIPPTYLPIDPKWIALRDDADIKTMLICYTYWFYQANSITSTVGTGTAKTKSENSTPASPIDKMTRSWNEMHELAVPYNLSTVDYPSYVHAARHCCCYGWAYPCRCVNEIFKPKNSLGI